jgi:hypothetical protein
VTFSLTINLNRVIRDGTTELAALTCNRKNSVAYLCFSAGSLDVEYRTPLPTTNLARRFLICTSDFVRAPR